jgi:acetyltransferase
VGVPDYFRHSSIHFSDSAASHGTRSIVPGFDCAAIYIAADAIGLMQPAHEKLSDRLAVRPYPKEWERTVVFGENRTVFIRPIRPDDETLLRKFLGKVNRQDLRLRFFATIKVFSGAFIARLTQLDYARAMAFIAIDNLSGDILGVVRLHIDTNFEAGEYAILVRSDLKNQGLGWKLMELIIAYARNEGIKRIEGEVLAENTLMLEMCSQLGFQIETAVGEPSLRVVKLSMGA